MAKPKELHRFYKSKAWQLARTIKINATQGKCERCGGVGEMVLTFLASFAQEESRSVSENMKWRIKKDFEQGLIWGGNACLGYRLVNQKLQLVEDEASIVQLIYELYFEGYSDNTIAKILNDKEIKPHKAKL